MIDILLIFFLAFIQGITEFLPISSSAHLLLPSLLFNVTDQGLAFDIAVHAGTLMAVIFYFKNDLKKITLSFISKNHDDDKKFGILLIIATIPIVIVGLFMSGFLESRVFGIKTIAYANISFAILLFLSYRFAKQNKSLANLTILGAFFIGLIQTFALIPGASRSGTAITAALIFGLSLKEASKFSFMLAIPTIFGALTLMLLSLYSSEVTISVTPLLIGFFTSIIFAFYTIKYFLIFVEKVGMYPFVIYRIFLGIMLLAL